MKKRMSRILSILLAFALIVSAGDVVRAEDVDEQKSEAQEMTEVEATEPEAEQPADEPEITITPVEDTSETEETATEEKKAEDTVKEEADDVLEEGIESFEAKSEESLDVIDMSELSKDLMTQATVTKAIPVKTAATGSETLTESEIAGIAYTQADVKSSGYCGYSQAFSVPAKGTLSFAVGVMSGTRVVNFGVYKDANMSQPVGTYSVSGVGNTASRIFTIPSAGTYYIGVNSSIPSTGTVAQTVGAGAIFYNGGDRTISSGQQIAVGQTTAQVNYFAIKAASTGYLMVQGDNTAKYYKVALCDSSKKALSAGTEYVGDVPTYGVTAKKTYYLRVTSASNSSGGYIFKATNTKISEKSGKTKKKAVTIKKKKTKKGTIQAGTAGKQADWYKFKLTGKKKVTISVTTGSNDAMKIIVYKGGKKIMTKTARGNTTGTITSVGKWPKGTYYIKVQRGNAKSSGYYTLKWK